MWGVRNSRRYFKRRGGWTQPTSPGFKYKDPQLYNGQPFRIDSNTTNGIVRQPTGGRTSGKDKSYGRPDTTGGRYRARRRPYPAIDQDQVKDGPFYVGPMPGSKPGYEFIPIPIPIPFGKINRKRVSPSMAGSTYSYSKLFAPKRTRQTKTVRYLSRQVPDQYCEYMKTWRSETAVGAQNYYVYSWLSGGVMNNMVANAAQSSGPKTGTLWLKRGVLSTMMTNNSNVNAFIEIWEGYYRRSTKDDASTLWRQGLTDQGALGPASAPTYPDLLYGMDPLKSRMFTQFCRVTDVHSVELAPGKSHQHRARLYANAKYNNEMYQEYSGATLDNFGGVTRWMFIIIRGAPINSLGSPGNVSTGIVALDIITTTKYNYIYTQPSTTGVFTSMTLPTISDPETVNVATGTGAADTKW